MNKKEMMDKIVEMENEIKNLKEELSKQEEPKTGRRWKPEVGEIYYFITSDGDVACNSWDNCRTDNGRYTIGNMFKAKKEARIEIERLKVLAELKEYADDDKEWDGNNNHLYITYDCESKIIDFLITDCFKESIDYFTSKEQAQKAIDAIGEERLKKYYFCVEE